MSFVYFAGCGDLVKIGITRTVYQRIKTLNTSSPTPIVLLAHMAGGAREEQLLLRMGKREGLHVRGEWFRNDKSLKALIAEIAEGPSGAITGWNYDGDPEDGIFTLKLGVT